MAGRSSWASSIGSRMRRTFKGVRGDARGAVETGDGSMEMADPRMEMDDRRVETGAGAAETPPPAWRWAPSSWRRRDRAMETARSSVEAARPAWTRPGERFGRLVGGSGRLVDGSGRLRRRGDEDGRRRDRAAGRAERAGERGERAGEREERAGRVRSGLSRDRCSSQGTPSGAVPRSMATGDGKRWLDGRAPPFGRARECARQPISSAVLSLGEGVRDVSARAPLEERDEHAQGAGDGDGREPIEVVVRDAGGRPPRERRGVVHPPEDRGEPAGPQLGSPCSRKRDCTPDQQAPQHDPRQQEHDPPIAKPTWNAAGRPHGGLSVSKPFPQ